MASGSLHVPVAIILLGGGLLACFWGYRLLRPLLAAYGFIGGAIGATLFIDGLQTWVAVIVTLAAGLAGALVAVLTYLAGVALFGAALGAVLLNAVSAAPEPDLWFVLGACLTGALLALAVRRYVLILATSFGGAWTTLVGALALAGNSAAVAAAGGNLEALPPVADPRAQLWFVVGWCGLGATAMLIQLRDLASRLRDGAEEGQLERRRTDRRKK